MHDQRRHIIRLAFYEVSNDRTMFALGFDVEITYLVQESIAPDGDPQGYDPRQ